MPPKTTNTKIIIDILYPNLDDCTDEILWEYKTPATPAKAADIEKAKILYLVILIPTIPQQYGYPLWT